MEYVDTPLSEIKGIPPRFIPKLKKLKIVSARDLLFYIPNRYVDFSHILKISELISQKEATIHGTVIKINSRRTWRRNMYLMEAYMEDESGVIRAAWFNQPYIKNNLPVGREANFSGKPTLSKTGELYLLNPTYEIAQKDTETKHTARIVPIYSETKGLTSKGIRYLISILLKKQIYISETLPKSVLQKEHLPDVETAIKNAHFPETLASALVSKKRFIFEKLFLLQLKNIREKTRLKTESAFAISFDAERIKELLKTLPFELTFSQKKSLFEILKDIEHPNPMNRLLQGDVGSGKTIVVAITALVGAEKSSIQTAFMAPTEILARQHYKTFQKFFPSFEKGVALLTSSEARIFYGKELETKIKKTSLVREIENGTISIIVGTHALIQKGVKFNRLGLVIIDEQHRFGVKQRAMLLRNANNTNKDDNLHRFIPHLLSMSATPIPRTLNLAIFGDLDVSIINELPKNRKQIITKVVSPEKRYEAYEFIRKQMQSERQVFVVCPRIEKQITNNEELTTEELGMLEIKSVKEEYEKLSKKIFPEFKISMLHGKIPSKEKEIIMSDFSHRKINLIVSTSVIEVGVDMPNASIMMIEGAERFGLAQLYQFRGRVGRGEHQSYCFLFTDSRSQETKKRLLSIVEAKNGFELAEKDLAIRGPGEFLGEAQTGMPDYVMQALQNPELLQNARKRAQELLSENIELTKYPELLRELSFFEKQIHLE